MIFIILEFGNGPDICCSIIQGDSFNYHHRNVRSRVSVSNFQVSVSAFMTKSRSRSRLESWARSRTRRLRSRLYHCNTQIYVTWTSNNGVISSGDLYYCLLPQCEALHTCRSSFLIKTQEIFFLLFHSPNTCNIYLDLNLATFQYIDGFWCFFLLEQILIEIDNFFELCRSFRFSFGTTCLSQSILLFDRTQSNWQKTIRF